MKKYINVVFMYFVMVKRGLRRRDGDLPSWFANIFLVATVFAVFVVAFSGTGPQFSGVEGEEGIVVSHEFVSDNDITLSADVFSSIPFNLVQLLVYDDVVKECSHSSEEGDHAICEYTDGYQEGVYVYSGKYYTRIVGECIEGACTESSVAPVLCSAEDTDGGNNPMEMGGVFIDTIGISATDICLDDNYLKEYYCGGELTNQLLVEFYECTAGCVDGRCNVNDVVGVPDYNEDICAFGSASGNDPLILGGFSITGYGSIVDECHSDSFLWEYYCSGDYARGEAYSCDVAEVDVVVSDIGSFEVLLSGDDDDDNGDNGGSSGDDNNGGSSGCTESWSCTGWTDCIDGVRTRECHDISACGTTFYRPIQSENCETPGNAFFPFDLKSINWWYASAFIVGALVLIWLVAFILKRRGWK